MLQLEHFSLIPIEELEIYDENTWLYVLEQKLSYDPTQNTIQLSVLNSTINLKDTSQWLDNLNPGDILLQEVIVPDSISENDQSKIIDTRTFTRPRKNRHSPSPLRPVTQQAETTSANLNSTFNFKVGETINGELLNATIVIDDPANKFGVPQSELNATFPVELNEAPEEELSPCNNNVYNLNSTFPTQVNRSAVGSLPVKAVLNATYSEEEPVQGPVATESRNCSLDEVEELEELEEGDDRCDDLNELVFRKPLMPGAVPKRPLIRTSTWNTELIASPKKQISPPTSNGLKDIEKIAKLQEDSLAQTSTPMGQRHFCAFQGPTEVDQNLGSPISSLADGTINFGPPIPLRESIAENANADSILDNSNSRIRGHLTFDKSQNSVENQSNSPTSPASSPYSSQSLDSETAGPSTTQDLIRRSMPNLNNQSRMRLPQPSTGNLNRQHGSDSGLRPPSAIGSGIRAPICSAVNSSSMIRPQFKVPAPPTQVLVNSIRGPAVATNLARPTQLLQPRSSATQPQARNSLLPNLASKLKPLQLVTPRASGASAASLPVKVVIPTAKAADDLNATVIMDKPSVVAASVSTAPSALPVFSGIPRPNMSRIPMPRTMKSSIPTPATRPRAPPQ